MRSRNPTTSIRDVHQGFTLVELVVTVAVAGIMLAIAVPSMTHMIRGNRLSTSANELVAMLQAARSEAITNRASVSVCPSSNGTSCGAGGGNRWIAVMEKDGTATVVREVLLNPAVQVSSSANLAAGGDSFTFFANGFSRTGTRDSGTVAVCVPELDGENTIDISASVGRVSTARRAGGAGCDAPADN